MMKRTAFPGVRWFFGLLAVLALAGCAHYRLGTGAETGFRSIYIAPVANKTSVPQAQALLSSALRRQFLKDGRLREASSPAEADATLEVVLVGYGREPGSARPGDTGLARTFATTLRVHATLRDNRAGKTLFEARPIDAMREVYTDSGQLQAEYQMLPLLAEAIALRTAAAVLDVW